MKNKLLLGNLTSDRLVIKDAVIEEEQQLKKICDSWTDKELLEGDAFTDDYIRKGILEGDLPPVENASKENHRFKSIYLDNTIIGFIDLYLGYPTPDVLWIGLFVIDNEYQSKGYAKEVINVLGNEVRNTNYTKMGIGVYLKNWKGLNFWIKEGFNKITGMYGDKEYSENTFAFIGMIKELD
ncbi:GNAT family N-acetyltransferase [Breznakia pachnodae]|uniref:GNAT superfamily N-acetyltransferase n=1 Tax=Breznakia pachnodae TaxID=265178 RepID=A0ABU0E2S1_9FIRM|nr:GNAT family N-acetyltransferase [Breznakia pachnodae]MDQ0360800.1 GNAT superfamily N-acetyltransferase [Breznakia pachnodae]